MQPLEALGQVAWVTDYEDDIASDLSVFHRIDDPGSMNSIDYLKKARRLFAYKGVLRARLEHEQNQQGESSPSKHAGQKVQEVPLEMLLPHIGPYEHVKEGVTDG